MTHTIDFAAVHAMRDELTKLIGGKAQVLAYMVKNKALHMKDQFRVFSAELARRGVAMVPVNPGSVVTPAAKPAAPAETAWKYGAATLSTTPPAKQQPAATIGGTLTREQFEALSHRDRAVHFHKGGKLID